MKFVKYLIFFSFWIFSASFAENSCGRVATVNFQDILIDNSTNDRGEGLRYLLEKDPVALSYLNSYQTNSRLKWQTAAVGSVGTGLMIGSLFIRNKQVKKIAVITGAVTLIINIIVAKTLEIQNEQNLEKAIQEYNLRNLPTIHYQTSTHDDLNLLYYSVSWSF